MAKGKFDFSAVDEQPTLDTLSNKGKFDFSLIDNPTDEKKKDSPTSLNALDSTDPTSSSSASASDHPSTSSQSPADVYTVTPTDNVQKQGKEAPNIAKDVIDILSSPAQGFHEGLKGGAEEIKNAPKAGLGTGTLQVLDGLSKMGGGLLQAVPVVAAITTGATALEKGLDKLPPEFYAIADASGGLIPNPKTALHFASAPIRTTLEQLAPEALKNSPALQAVAGIGDFALPLAVGVLAVKKPALAKKFASDEPVKVADVEDAHDILSKTTPTEIRDVAKDLTVKSQHPDVQDLKKKEIDLTQDHANISSTVSPEAAAPLEPEIRKTTDAVNEQQKNVDDKSATEQAISQATNDESKAVLNERLKTINEKINTLRNANKPSSTPSAEQGSAKPEGEVSKAVGQDSPESKDDNIPQQEGKGADGSPKGVRGEGADGDAPDASHIGHDEFRLGDKTYPVRTIPATDESLKVNEEVKKDDLTPEQLDDLRNKIKAGETQNVFKEDETGKILDGNKRLQISKEENKPVNEVTLPKGTSPDEATKISEEISKQQEDAVQKQKAEGVPVGGSPRNSAEVEQGVPASEPPSKVQAGEKQSSDKAAEAPEKVLAQDITVTPDKIVGETKDLKIGDSVTLSDGTKGTVRRIGETEIGKGKNKKVEKQISVSLEPKSESTPSEPPKGSEKQSAKDQIAKGVTNAIGKFSNKKNLLPEEQTSLYNDIKDVIEGAIKLGGITIKEAVAHAIESVKNSDWYKSYSDADRGDVDKVMGDLEKEYKENEDDFFASIKQRHLKEDWVNEIKSKIPKGAEPREREVFNKVADDFKNNKISDKQIDATEDRLINNKKSDLRDVAIVLANKIRLQSLENTIRDGIADADKAGDIYKREALQNDLSTLEPKQYKNTQAAVMAGRERFAFTGRLLQSEAEEDFSISKIKHDLQEANIGKKNIADVMREADELKTQLDASERKLRKLQEKKPKRVYSDKETTDIDAWNKKAKAAIDKLLDFGKGNLPEGTQYADFGSEAVRKALHLAVDGVTEAIKAGKALVDAIKEQIEKFRDSDFYKGLSDTDKKEHEEKFGNILDEAFNSTSKTAELKDAYEKTLERAIANNEEKIAKIKSGESETKKEPRELSPREKELKDKNDGLKKELADLRKKDTVRAADIRKKSRETRILNENPKLKKQLEDIEKTGDYTTPEKPNTPISKEVEEVRLENENIKGKIRDLKAKVDFKNMNNSERGLFYAKKILRFAILSGVHSIGKIGELMAARPFTSVPDAMMAETFGKVFKSLAEESPTYNPIGYKEALKTEYNGFVKGYSKYVDNIVKILKTGKGNVEFKYGKDSKQAMLHTKVLDFWQDFHKILKEPTRKTGVYKGLVRATNFAKIHGMDLTEPDTQVFIAEVAKEFGDRQILMNDNRFTDILSNLQQKTEDMNKVAGAVLYSKKPVTKVPTNFIGESLERIFGLPRALGKSVLNVQLPAATTYAKGFTKAGERITFKEAINRTVQKLGETREGQKKVDSIIRNFSYGGTTLFYFGLAYTFHKEIGKLLDMLPKWARHIPQIAPLNIGAKTGEMHEANHKFLKSLGQSTVQESKDLVKSAPLVSSIIYEAPKAARALLAKGESGLQKTMDFLSDESGQEVSEYNPQIVQQIAKWLDEDNPNTFKEWLKRDAVNRSPKGFEQEIEVGMPGLRKRVHRDWYKQ